MNFCYNDSRPNFDGLPDHATPSVAAQYFLVIVSQQNRAPPIHATTSYQGQPRTPKTTVPCYYHHREKYSSVARKIWHWHYSSLNVRRAAPVPSPSCVLPQAGCQYPPSTSSPTSGRTATVEPPSVPRIDNYIPINYSQTLRKD